MHETAGVIASTDIGIEVCQGEGVLNSILDSVWSSHISELCGFPLE